MTTMSGIGSAGGYASLFSSSATSNWIGDTMTAIKQSATTGGIMGALAHSGDGSVSSFLERGAMMASNLAIISQTGVTNASSLISQIAQQNQQKRADEVMQKVMADLEAERNKVKPENVLDPTIFFANGSTLDTETNILTMSDGTQFDTTTGTKYFDPADIVQLANGAYLDTKNNILTMADGTKIDTVTGLKVSVEA
jgi:hypothetical protein